MDFSSLVKKSFGSPFKEKMESPEHELALFALQPISISGNSWGELWWGDLFLQFTPKKIVQLLQIDGDGRLPCPDHHFDVFLTPTGLGSLKKDVLYMLLAELRRVLKPEGIWIAMSGESLNGPSSLELSHFISPEDWKILREKSLQSPNGRYRYFELQRISE